MPDVEMHRFDVSITSVIAGMPSRTCKMEVLAQNWADAATASIKKVGPADRVCVIVSAQKVKKEKAA